jgi:hypothetical protein
MGKSPTIHHPMLNPLLANQCICDFKCDVSRDDIAARNGRSFQASAMRSGAVKERFRVRGGEVQELECFRFTES